MRLKKLPQGASLDAILLTFIKLVTTVLGLAVTRLLSQYLSVHDYGTYSQILLVVSTVRSLTTLGMVDGVSYFYCSEQDEKKRESYIATIFALQAVISAVSGGIVLMLSGVISENFENPDVKGLLVFAGIIPLLQNLIPMLQILIVSVGKARMLAVRNFVVSAVRLLVVIAVVTIVQHVVVMLITSVILEVAQILTFVWTLRKNDCVIRLRSVCWRMSKEILHYCVPMAIFISVNALSRDCDKYLITLMTDTETLAMYTNASKPLPFDIIMASFTTVLRPQITMMVEKEKERAAAVYKVFLEVAYISTTILCCAALAAAPQMMVLFYSEKYLSGLTIFCIYILVDMVRFTNITLVLSAAGKTRLLMVAGIGSFVLNAVLNIVFYYWMGTVGPAVATLATILIMGVTLLSLSAGEMNVTLWQLFDGKCLLTFAVQSAVTLCLAIWLRRILENAGLHYFVILVVVCAAFAGVMLLLQGKRLLRDLKSINKTAKKV